MRFRSGDVVNDQDGIDEPHRGRRLSGGALQREVAKGRSR